MKKLYFFFIFMFVCTVNAQIVNIPNANFKAKLLQASPSIQIAKSTAGLWIKIDTNNDGEIQTSEAAQVGALYVNFSSISALTGIESFVNLKVLSCYNNSIATLDVSTLPLLEELYCYNNNLTALNVSNTSLKRLECQYNYVLNNLQHAGLDDTLEYFNNNRTSVISLNFTNYLELKTLIFNDDTYGSGSNILLQNLTLNNCPKLDFINQIENQNRIYFVENILINGCNLITNFIINPNSNGSSSNLTISNCNNLEVLRLSGLSNTSLDVSTLTSLTTLELYYSNNLTALDLSNLTNLNNAYLFYNSSLASLNITGLENLTILKCSNNALIALDVSGLTNLINLDCSSNQILSLNLTGLSNLRALECYNNQLLSLDLSDCHSIIEVYCANNQIIELFMKNGKQEIINFGGNPILLYICTDDNEMASIQSQVDALSYNNCQVNSYCTFAPGGSVFNLLGQTKLDMDSNGCSITDINYTNLRFNISDGTNSGSFLANETGNYAIPVSAGTHTVTPVLENPSYFSISPTSFNITFPTTASPFTQDFCVTPNGNHSDIEIAIIPIDFPVPGFNVKYKLVYKNKGNQVANGQISLTYEDAVLDYISSNPIVFNTPSGVLSWNYTNLVPFETRTIEFIVNLNTPMETPSLNGGDILDFTATINPTVSDETPLDNIFSLNQTVVNSYDPNDKTCLEGETIDPSMIGKYVHYQIRFENTGTFPAQNVVVKDMIDITKFDIASLQLVNTSHNCYARITGNKVEFIFENINLPFEDDTNDGYIVFKIKTLPSLTINSTISNTAEIYFDYNFPIITNTATSTYQTLANPSFDFENEFSMYPNPVKNTLNISAKNNLEISSVEVYNLVGQLVIVKPNFSESLDISSIASGTYFIKVNTKNGNSTAKFVKE